MDRSNSNMDRTPMENTLQERERGKDEREEKEMERDNKGQSDIANGSKEEKTDGGEGGAPGPPQPVGFFHHSLFHIRNHVIRLWTKTVLLLCIGILGILPIYWGVLFRASENLHLITIAVVDFDGQVAPYTATTPLIGPLITQMTEQMNHIKGPHLDFKIMSPAEFQYDPIAVRQYIYDFHAWTAIIINPNATALLESAVQNGNASYDPIGAAQLVYVEARDQTAHPTYIQPVITKLQAEIISKFGSMWAHRVLTNNSIPRSNLALAPQALSPAIGFSIFNLRPFGPATVTPAVSIGLIYLIIIAFFSFSFFLPIHMKYIIPKGHPPLHFRHLIIWRWVSTMAAYFFMSLCYSLISLAYQIPFSTGPASPVEVAQNPTAYGSGTFAVYWMLNFVSMAALGLACENVAMVIGMPWTALWLIFWVITNVSTGFYPLELAPQFYYWGYAWPLHNIVEASRQLLFDLHSRIGLNFGILFTWVAVNTVLFPICCYIMRWKQGKEKEKAQREHHHKGR